MNDLIDRTNNHPYLIAVGDSVKEIIQFYIEVEKHLLPVSVLFDSIE